MKLHKVREEINKSTITFLERKFGLTDTWFDTQTFSFAGPMQLQPISRIIEHKLRHEIFNEK